MERNFRLINPFLQIKVLSKLKFYSALLSRILWQKEGGFRVPVLFEGNALSSAEELTTISLRSVKIDNQELGIVPENQSDIKDSGDKEWVLSGDKPGANSDIG